MKNKLKEKLINMLFILLVIMFIIGMLMLISLFVVYIIALLKYGNTPIAELPTWAWWIFGGNK